MTNTLSSKDAYSLMLKEYPDVLDINQMCDILGVSTKTGYKILKAGTINSLKIGRTYRIPKVHVISFLRMVDEQPAM
jgi:excisionase family DNA binding protein